MNSFQRAIANLFKIPVPTEKPGRGYGIRKYAGASTSTTGVFDWLTSQTSADSEIWSSLRLLISRSRSLYQDDSNVQTAVDELVSLVVDTGIHLQSQVKMKRGGGLNLRLNEQIERKFRLWADNPRWCDVTGRQTFWQIQATVLHSMMVDGGILVRVVNQRFADSPVPFALELIEIDQLDDRLNFARANNGNEIRMGVEVDDWKRPVAYWVLDDHPGDYYGAKSQNFQSRPVSAWQIEHIVNRQGFRPGQTRGVPAIHAGILKARNLLGLEESEIVKARVQSCISAFIENEAPDIEPEFEDESGQWGKELYPGLIEYLQPGQKLAAFDPSSPNPNLKDFVQHFQRGLARIFGLSAYSVTGDLSDANYSSLREGKLSEWRRVKLMRDRLNTDLNSPVFRRWLDAAAMSGFLTMPGDYEFNKSEYWCDSWFGASMPWVDPLKDTKATELEITLGLTTRTRFLAEKGIDYEDILREKAREMELEEKYGVSFEPIEVEAELLQPEEVPPPQLPPSEPETPPEPPKRLPRKRKKAAKRWK